MIPFLAWVALLLGPTAPSAPAVPRSASVACVALNGRQVSGARILAASTQDAGPEEAPGADTARLPPYCRVAAQIVAEPGSDIRLEVWLPLQGWDGRLNAAGNGGFAGAIDHVSLAAAIRAGQVGLSTDTGHVGQAEDGAWAKGRPERVRDYGWRAVHLSTVAAKAITAQVYGRPPEHAYFASCSNGGRQGLMEAQRFPDDYDGIIAGAPALDWTGVAAAMIWDIQALTAPGARIDADQAAPLQAAVRTACGGKDGYVDAPLRCRFDPAVLGCGATPTPGCFTPPQVTALRRIYAGPSSPGGRQLYPGFAPSGGEIGSVPGLGWDGWIFPVGTTPSHQSAYPAALLEDFARRPLAKVDTFNFARDPKRVEAALARDLDAKNPDMEPFFRRGGKLILWHGWADPALPPQGTLDFYREALKRSGPTAATSVRLLMAPGVQHCFGGPGPNSFGQFGAPPPGTGPNDDLVSALEAWVERGRSPQSVTARYRSDGPAGAMNPLPGSPPTTELAFATPN